MASKKWSSSRKPAGFGTKDLTAELTRAEAMIVRKKWAEALALLEDLHDSYPKQPDVLRFLADVYYEFKDLTGYQRVCQQLLELNPNDADITLNLASVYLSNLHPFLALRTFRSFVERWPNHKFAKETQKMVAELEQKVDSLLAEMKLPEAGGLEIATLHEEGQAYLEQGNYEQARQSEEALLNLHPDFIPAWNNLSLTAFMEGNSEEAIAHAQKALEIQPNNIHALSNLTRFLFLDAQIDQAQQFVERLKAIPVLEPELWVKKVEALSFLGDNQGILDIFEQVKANNQLKSIVNPLFNHLVAVALMRLGQTKEARQQWQEALKKSPEFNLAKTNLEDLRHPVHARHAPWSFDMGSWLNKHTFDELIALVQSASSKNETKFKQLIQGYLKKHARLLHLVPILLDRGDPQGREFALRFAEFTATPEMLTALKDFALSDRGPDALRHQAANKVAEAGLLPENKARMWINGEWREIMLMNYEFYTDPPVVHSGKVKKLLSQAIPLIKTGDPESAEKAEQLLKKAIAITPTAPDLQNNLASAYQMQGRFEEAEALIQEIADRYPDYMFARVAIALQHIDNGNIEAAEALLKPFLTRRKFHILEFAAFSNAYIELLLAQKNHDAAQGWLSIWENVDPDHPLIKDWKQRLKSAKRSSKK